MLPTQLYLPSDAKPLFQWPRFGLKTGAYPKNSLSLLQNKNRGISIDCSTRALVDCLINPPRPRVVGVVKLGIMRGAVCAESTEHDWGFSP